MCTRDLVAMREVGAARVARVAMREVAAKEEAGAAKGVAVKVAGNASTRGPQQD